MDRTVWLVILGSALSIISSAITTWLAHTGNLRRENESRSHARRVKLADLQATALLELQDAMTELMAASMAEWKIKELEQHDAFPGVASRSLLARASLAKSIVRVSDEQVKSLAKDFNLSSLPLSFPEHAYLYDKHESKSVDHIGANFTLANERIGVVLEELYNA